MSIFWVTPRGAIRSKIDFAMEITIGQCENELERLSNQVRIDRDVFNQPNFDATFGFSKRIKPTLAQEGCGWIQKACRCSAQRIRLFFLVHFPILAWLPKYSVRRDFVYDIIGGLTVGVMHIPQGMAYGMLAGLDRVNGLYTSFFPNLLYVFLGTSRHVSIGTFAVISVMMGSLQDRLIPQDGGNVSHYHQTPPPDFPVDVTPVELATSVTVLVGIILLCMGTLRLGFLTNYLSDSLISGFTTGAALHVLFSQLPSIFGLPRPKCDEIGKLFCSARQFIRVIKGTNLVTFAVSVISIVLIYITKEFIGPCWTRRTALPMPAELLAIVLGTVASYFGSFESLGVSVVGSMPRGLPLPTFPRMDLIPWIIGDSISLAIVIFSVTVSVAKIFAKKHNYKIDSNQELFALGFVQCFCSIFSCFPPSGSLARSALFESTGTRTQVAAVVGCGVVLVVLLWLGPLFYALPACVLAAIITVALKSMFLQVTTVKHLMKVSKVDGFIWISSFLSVACLGVTYGLAASVAIGLLTLILRLQWPNVTLLHWMPNTEIYKDGRYYAESQSVYGVKIFRFDAPLNFANAERFKACLLRKCDIDPDRTKAYLRTCPAFPPSPPRRATTSVGSQNGNDNVRASTPVCSIQQTMADESEYATEGGDASTSQDTFVDAPCSPAAAMVSLRSPLDTDPTSTEFVIIDCSSFGHVDMMGLNILKQVYLELRDIGIRVLFTSCRASLIAMFGVSDFYKTVPEDCFYATIHDAVVDASGGNIVGLKAAGLSTTA